jgi:hypothetical protein
MEKGFPQTWQPPQIQETKKYRNQATFLSKNVDCSLELLISWLSTFTSLICLGQSAHLSDLVLPRIRDLGRIP